MFDSYFTLLIIYFTLLYLRIFLRIIYFTLNTLNIITTTLLSTLFYVFVHYVSSELFSCFSISYKRAKIRSLPVINAYHRKN